MAMKNRYPTRLMFLGLSSRGPARLKSNLGGRTGRVNDPGKDHGELGASGRTGEDNRNRK